MPTYIGEYEIVRTIKAVGMHRVCEARHRDRPKERVAIKFLHPAFANDGKLMDGLRKEMAIASRLTHPGIVRVSELIETSEGPALVMEYLRGHELGVIIRGGASEPAKVRLIMRQVLDAMACAHSSSPPILHLDLKPGNIFVCEDESVRILDFGLARAVWGQLDKRRQAGDDGPTGDLSGTAPYVAPEVWEGAKPTASVDIYALGLIAWELLSGRPACAVGSPAAAMAWHLRGELHTGHLTSDLAALIHHMVAREPRFRYPDAQQALVAWTDSYLPMTPLSEDYLPQNDGIEREPTDEPELILDECSAESPMQTEDPKEHVPVTPHPPDEVADPAPARSAAPVATVDSGQSLLQHPASAAADVELRIGIFLVGPSSMRLRTGTSDELIFSVQCERTDAFIEIVLQGRAGAGVPQWAQLIDLQRLKVRRGTSREVRVSLHPTEGAPSEVTYLRLVAKQVGGSEPVAESDWCKITLSEPPRVRQYVELLITSPVFGALLKRCAIPAAIAGLLGCLWGEDTCLPCLMTSECSPGVSAHQSTEVSAPPSVKPGDEIGPAIDDTPRPDPDPPEPPPSPSPSPSPSPPPPPTTALPPPPPPPKPNPDRVVITHRSNRGSAGYAVKAYNDRTEISLEGASYVWTIPDYVVARKGTTSATLIVSCRAEHDYLSRGIGVIVTPQGSSEKLESKLFGPKCTATETGLIAQTAPRNGEIGRSPVPRRSP